MRTNIFLVFLLIGIQSVYANNIIQTSTGVYLKLITSTSKAEIWKDLGKNLESSDDDGLIWGDVHSKTMNHFSTIDYEKDQNGNYNYEKPIQKICTDSESLPSRGHLEGLSWRLPTRTDFFLAQKRGIFEVLPNMEERWFWTASIYEWGEMYNPSFAYNFSLKYGMNNTFRINKNISVRCVSP